MPQALSAEITDELAEPFAASKCQLYQYALGPKSDIDRLYPAIKTPYMSDQDSSMAVAASIQLYLWASLDRDQIHAYPVTVRPNGEVYDVSICSPDPRAARYEKTQTSWLENAKLGLQAIPVCQNDPSCWEPNASGVQCLGPWQFYLPLGLPMISQKMVMLLHYPPYVSMEQSDYLNNATLNRWQRLLLTVGVPSNDVTLYTTIVDVFPIAAPGSGESQCFTPDSAMTFFGGYVQAMLNALVIPSAPEHTIPIIIFGAEARGYWNKAYTPTEPTDVLKAGSVSLDAKAPETKTPYIGANHPILAAYPNTCPSQPTSEPAIVNLAKVDLVTIAKEDLTTACFAKTMATTPDADPVAVAADCKDSYFSVKPDMEHASRVCVTAVIDQSKPQWTKSCAKTWCDAHNNAPCPLPDYTTTPCGP